MWALNGDLLRASSPRAQCSSTRIDPKHDPRAWPRIPMRSPQGDFGSPLFLMADDERVRVIGAEGALHVQPARNAT